MKAGQWFKCFRINFSLTGVEIVNSNIDSSLLIKINAFRFETDKDYVKRSLSRYVSDELYTYRLKRSDSNRLLWSDNLSSTKLSCC